MALVARPHSQTLRHSSEPSLLEYRAESDFDAEFIPKTVVGFAAGSMVMGFLLNFSQSLWMAHLWPMAHIINTMLLRFALNVGFTGIAGSLLLVTLKARADHTSALLYHKDWMNPLGTGCGFAALIWLPWILFEQGVHHDLFILAGLWMLVMLYPVVAAMWVVGPHKERVHS